MCFMDAVSIQIDLSDLFTGNALTYNVGGTEGQGQLAPDTVYIFKVKACNKHGDGATSATVSVTTLSLIASPQRGDGSSGTSTSPTPSSPVPLEAVALLRIMQIVVVHSFHQIHQRFEILIDEIRYLLQQTHQCRLPQPEFLSYQTDGWNVGIQSAKLVTTTTM